MSGPQRRQWMLGGALVVTLALTAWAASQPEEDAVDIVQVAVAEPKPPRDDRPSSAVADHPAMPETPGQAADRMVLSRDPDTQAVGELFAPKSWTPPPPPPQVVAPAPPPPPTAPPLPFVFIGKLADGPQTTVFLARHDQNYVVKPGDILDGTYRVDGIQGATMTLTYLPLNQKQTLHIGATD